MMKNVLILVLLLIVACNMTDSVEKGHGEQIGVVTMQPDNTLVLQLRAFEGEVLGEGYFEYKETDKDYDKILKHIGEIEPGQTKPVYPFPPDH